MTNISITNIFDKYYALKFCVCVVFAPSIPYPMARGDLRRVLYTF